MNDSELLGLLTSMKDMMLSVSTGGQRIEGVNATFKQSFEDVDLALRSRGIGNPIPYSDLWDWHLRWSSGDLPSYRSRRAYVTGLFTPLLSHIRQGSTGHATAPPEPTGWARVDRTVG